MAEIIAAERATRAAGPGLSYWLGSKCLNAPLAMESQAAARLQGALRDKAFDGQVTIGLASPLASRFVGQPAGKSGYRVTDDGIALVPISGMLLDRGEWLGDMGGWFTSYEGIAEQCRRIAKDDAISHVVLDIDSPGGMAAGVFEAAQAIIELRKKKRITAIAANAAYSAAYAIACVADDLFVTSTGGVGSVGVIRVHMSYADMLGQMGVEPTIIHAGAHKPNGNPYQPLSHNARAEAAAECDLIYDLFAAHVARERSLTTEAVRATEARCYLGEKAVAAKLADGVKSFEEVLVHVRAAKKKGGRPRGESASTSASKPSSKTGDPGMAGNNPSGDRPDYDGIIAAALSQIAANAARPVAATEKSAAAVPAAPAVAQGPSASDERGRIRAILGSSEAKTRGALASHIALNTDLSAEQAVAILAAAPAEQAPAAAAPTQQSQLNSALHQQMAKPGNAAGVKPEAEAQSSRPTLAARAKAFGRRRASE